VRPQALVLRRGVAKVAIHALSKAPFQNRISEAKQVMHKVLCASVVFFTFAVATLNASAQDDSNLVKNPGFEEGNSNYNLFVGGDSKDKNCRFSIDSTTAHSGTQSALLQADDFARVALGPQVPIPVISGERYRVGVWVKPGADFQTQPGSPGVVMRLNLSQNNGPSPAGLIFIFLNDTVFPINTPPSAPLAITAPLSADWTHIEAIVEVPDNVDSIQPVLYLWKAKGSLYVDDFTFQKVDAATPLSALAGGASSPGAKSVPTLPIPTQAQIDEIAAMLPDVPQGVGRPISDRAAWAVAAQKPPFQRLYADAKKFALEPIPVLNDALYHEILKTNNGGSYLGPFQKRSRRLIDFVVAEGIEDKGAYLPLIEKELDAILSEESWTAPTEVLIGKLPDGMNGIDLSASARAWTVATTDYWLGDKLKPETRQRIRAELQRRIFDRYEAAVKSGKVHWWWMTSPANWNAVCHAGVTGAALAILPSKEERALFIRAAQDTMPYYIGGFGDDGYCREAMSYWRYGFGNYLCLSETIYEATQGKINLFAGDKLRRIALFPRHFEIMDGIYPAIGDSELILEPPKTPAAGADLLLFINQRWGMGWTDLKEDDSEMYVYHPGGNRLSGVGIFGFPLPIYGGSVVAGSPASPAEAASNKLRYYFPDGGLLITRSEQPGKARMGVSIKGGNNNNPHGHPDNGSYVVVVNDETLLVDPGAEPYTAKTFGPHRLESMMLNSYGHDVPYVGKTLQNTGPSAEGKILSTDFSAGKDTLKMDLTTSYPVPGLKKLLRTFVLDRAGPSLEITDEAEFSQPTDFGTALVTTSPFHEEGPGSFLISGKKTALKATVTVDGLSLNNAIEPITGHSPIPAKPMRLGVNVTEPVEKVVMHTVIVPADLPAPAPPAPAPAPAP
jgi:hypothetical protein